MPAKHTVRISNDTRAVTTSIGYILTFAVLLAAITAIAATGTTIVTDQEAAATTDQAITDINAVASNIDAATSGYTGPVTRTTIDADPGSVSGGPDTHIRVNVTDTATGDEMIHTFNTTAITRQTGDGDTRYVGGLGAHTTTEGESRITHHPDIRETSDGTVVVTVKNVTSDDENTRFRGDAGSGDEVTVVAEHEKTLTGVVRSDDPGGDSVEVTVTVTGENTAVWGEVFGEAGFEEVESVGGEGSVSWSASTGEVRVRIPHVTVS